MRVTPECDSINSVIISSANDVQTMPEVVFGNDNYMVVWSDARIGEDFNIYGARVSPDGTVLDPDGILIGRDSDDGQYEPSLAFTGTRFFVVWVHYSIPFAVVGRFVNCDGTLGDTVHIAATADEGYRTSVCFDGTNFLVVWTQYPQLLMGQFVSSDGNLIGGQFTIATGVTTLGSGSLSFDGNCYTVVYTVRNIDIFEVWARQYDTSGNPLGPAFIVSNPANSSYDSYIVAGATNYLNVWTHMGYPSDIYGNVDLPIGIESGGDKVPCETTHHGATIITGPLRLPDGLDCRVFDITGREVTPSAVKAGVYFIEIEGEVVQKIIKVR
ncbi:MAG: hypothetical protein JSV98_09515 [candidate division WOR-3 bacterium]|nr:MAG: hypothetical protein JSV98_09515 [candidate division WOR-3 bacterium]